MMRGTPAAEWMERAIERVNESRIAATKKAMIDDGMSARWR
jgi:hypothetical protein